MRVLIICFALLCAIIGVRADSEVNVNFADLFKGLVFPEAAPAADCDAADYAILKHHFDTAEKCLALSNDADTHLYDSAGNILAPGAVDWSKLEGIHVEKADQWFGSCHRPSNMLSLITSPGQGGFKDWFACYYWPYQYYALTNWVLVSRSKSFDPETSLYNMITSAVATFTALPGQPNAGTSYDVFESYNSFYRELEGGKVIQTHLHYWQDSYAYGMGYAGPANPTLPSTAPAGRR